jgi:hypoxanthine phosphoribosyltransferase
MSTECNSSYLHSILDAPRLKKVVKILSKIIKKKVGVDNFDAIAYRGMSGAGVATTLGYIFSKPLVMVRKKGVESHTVKRVEGVYKVNRILIVDDCIATGETLVTMARDIIESRKKGFHDEPLEIVAVLLYNDFSDRYQVHIEEELPGRRFYSMFISGITNKDENQEALRAMMNMKVYSFCLEKKGKRYNTNIGTNLTVDDLK